MRRTSRPRQQDHALPVLAPQRRGAGSLFSKKLIHAQNSDRSRVLYPQYPVCVIPYRQKPPPEHMRPASSAASGSKTSRRPSAIAARRIFPPSARWMRRVLQYRSAACRMPSPCGKRGDGGSPGLHTDSGTEFRHFAFRTGRIAGIAHVPPEPYQAVIHVAPCIPWK